MLREADPSVLRELLAEKARARTHAELRDELARRPELLLERASSSPDLPLAEDTKRALAYAVHESESLGHPWVGTEHLLLGLMRAEEGAAGVHLDSVGLEVAQIRDEVKKVAGRREAEANAKAMPTLEEYARDFTSLAAEGGFDPLIGREEEVDRIIQILCRRTKNNPLLLGEAGVGKTAIIEGLATRIADGEVPMLLAEKRILALDLSLLVAGTKYRGQFEERLKTLLKELRDHPEVIIFIDEIHSLIGTGVGRGLARRRQHHQAGAVARRRSPASARPR